jgi:hypothetical protein
MSTITVPAESHSRTIRHPVAALAMAFAVTVGVLGGAAAWNEAAGSDGSRAVEQQPGFDPDCELPGGRMPC